MILTITQIKEILETKGQSVNLSKAIEHEQRVRFHSETSISKDTCSYAVTEFLDFIRTILKEDKFRMFVSLLRFPVSTVNLTKKIYSALSKIFDGKNPIVKYEFTNPDDFQDWMSYRKNTLNAQMTWKTKGYETMKTAINSIVVVDLPEQQATDKPEPYFYFLDLNNVVRIKLRSGSVSELDYLIFKVEDDKLAVFDDNSFRVFRTKAKGSTEINPVPIVESIHGLGFCPARFFWTTPVNYRMPEVKISPISNSLSNLDFLLFFSVGNEHLNTYGRYPIYSVFASDCDYVNSENGDYCDNGFLRTIDHLYKHDHIGVKQCPVCSKKRLTGAGSEIEIDPPSEDNGMADLRNPVQIIKIDRDSLDYNNEDIDSREKKIYFSSTGDAHGTINDQAINESQVRSLLDSMESALKMPQYNFEEIIEWTDKTICLLRYGDRFTGNSISLGTEHYILTTEMILKLYNAAKQASFSVSTLDMLEDLYYETELKNNPEQLRRQKVLNNLDPFRHRSISDVKSMYESNHVKYSDYMLKANFSSLIMRFERENISVVEFAQAKPFDEKIKLIKNVLYLYVEEMKPEVTEPAKEPAGII